MKNYAKIGLGIFLSLTPMMLSAAAGDPLQYAPVEGQVNNVMNIILLIVKAIGVGAIIWGVVELLIEKDQNGQQGKKLAGILKIIGGVLLIVIGAFVGWVSGDSGAAVKTTSLTVETSHIA